MTWRESPGKSTDIRIPDRSRTAGSSRAAGLERLAAEIASVVVQQIERIEDDGVPRVCRPVLQRLEGRPAVRVDGDDFAVDRRLPGVELSRRRRDARIGRREVLVVARANLDSGRRS